MSKYDKSVPGWAHDFRTVTASLLSYADLFAVSGCTKEQFLDGVRSNCGWLLEMIEGMALHVDNSETSVAGEDGSPSVRTIVESVVDTHRLAIQKLGIRLIIDVENGVIKLEASQVVIVKRILANLLSNAIRHSHGRAILIRVAQSAASYRGEEEYFCVLEVQDFGTGITRQQVKRLMRQDIVGQQGQGSRRQGRGLSTTRQLVECLGGKLTVQSEFGKGTRVSVEFIPGQAGALVRPVEPARSHPGIRDDSSTTGTCASENQDCEKMKIFLAEDQIETDAIERALGREARMQGVPNVLLIDDDFDLRAILSAVLRTEGIHITAVADEQAAMACRLSEFDCVLLDLNLGNLSGREVAQRLRQAGFLRPIYALTAEIPAKRFSSEREASAQGFDGWIDKGEGGRGVARRLKEAMFGLN